MGVRQQVRPLLLLPLTKPIASLSITLPHQAGIVDV